MAGPRTIRSEALLSRSSGDAIRNYRQDCLPQSIVMYGVPVPERASGVKGLLASFLGSPGGLFAYTPRLGPEGPFLGGSCSVEESVLEFDCHGHVLRGCSRRSFPCGGTPIHPFVNPPACSGIRSGRLGPDT